MCGICGAIASHSITGHEVTHIQKLLTLNYWRGKDSSGMFDVIEPDESKAKIVGKGKNKTKEIIHPTLYWKRTEPAFAFAHKEMEIQRSTRWADHTLRAVVCHARAATIGKVTVENAHPFVFNNILGDHNGTISGDFEGKKEHEVDSAAIFEGIQKNGIEKTLNTLYESSGQVAYALVWLDTSNNTIYFIRNGMRPLHYLSRSGTVYFSSDKRDLAYAFDVREYSPEIKEFAINILYSLDITKSTVSFTEKKLDIKTSSQYNYPMPWHGGGWYSETSYSSRGSSRSALNDDLPAEMRAVRNLPLLQDRNATAQADREQRAYEAHWREKSWKDFLDLGEKNFNQNHTEYDIAFGRWFTDYCFSQLQRWKKDHNIEYTKKLFIVWEGFTANRQAQELAKCKFPPQELDKARPPVDLIDSKGNVISLEEAREDLRFPFGVAGLKCSAEMYKQRVKCGCAQCGAIPTTEDADEIFWINGDAFLDFNCCWDIATTEDKTKLATYDQEKVKAFVDDISKAYGVSQDYENNSNMRTLN